MSESMEEPASDVVGHVLAVDGREENVPQKPAADGEKCADGSHDRLVVHLNEPAVDQYLYVAQRS